MKEKLNTIIALVGAGLLFLCYIFLVYSLEEALFIVVVILVTFLLSPFMYLLTHKNARMRLCERIKSIKITRFYVIYLLTSLLFLIALADLPYWYYTLLKLATCAVCAYSAAKTKREWIRWIFGVLAVLYNPVLPVHLDDKEVWTAVNIATAAFMWLTLYLETKERNKNV